MTSPAHPHTRSRPPTSTPAPNFDRVARIYRWAEYAALGPLLERTRAHFLPRLEGRRRALVLGDGDGRFLARLLRQSSALEALAVDTSAAMLSLLRGRCANASARLQTLEASALDAPVPPETDLIVTHFFLDCLTQPEVDALAESIAPQAQPGALWLLSDFAVPPTGPVRPLARAYLRSLYFAFRVLTGLRTASLPDPQASLARAGFTRLDRHERLFGVLYTELWRLGQDGQAKAARLK